mmetsp:Transcript_22038/g.35461  ORF Transcript_22038/g.35461 Transcript_22038/m.35461 type:complete len:140 (+) Transcript_22038:460-879(+)
MVWVQISSDLVSLEWQTLAKKKGSPLREGVLQLDTLSAVTPGNGSKTVRLRSTQGEILMEMDAESVEECEKWICALREATNVLENEFKRSKAKKQGSRRLEGKWLEMQRKKAAADAYKKKIGSTGMNYTARLMMERGGK